MPTVNEINEFLFTIAPFEMKAGFDNVGFLVGRGNSEASIILLSLDITDEVISEALDIGATLIVSHHPMFFSLDKVTDADPTGAQIIRMLSVGLAAICMHTNLDGSRGGINDELAVAVGIAENDAYTELLSEDGRLPTGEVFSYGRFGYLKKPCSLPDYLTFLKNVLKTGGLRYHDANRPVHKVAVAGGSGGDKLDCAFKHGCDTFVTADIKYHTFLAAKELGMNLIDADHFCTENVITEVLADKLRANFPKADVRVSKLHAQTVKFY